MDRRLAWVLGIIFGGLFLCFIGFFALMAFAIHGGGESSVSGDHVGVVEIVGPITDSKKTLKELKAFEKEQAVKAIVVRIDSPGGSVGPSQEIFEAIRKLRAKKKVVASMGSIAASGGFYIAVAADKVFANPGTLTGSIGVIFQLPNVQGLMKWAGVEMNTITAGKMKDSGSMFRTMRPDEREYFESVLADVHKQFIEAVATGRGLKVEDVQTIADGRVFTGRQAKDFKLVDELGGINDAIAMAATLGGIKGEPKAEYPREEKKFLRELLDSESSSVVHGITAGAIDELGGTGLQFRMPSFEAR